MHKTFTGERSPRATYGSEPKTILQLGGIALPTDESFLYTSGQTYVEYLNGLYDNADSRWQSISHNIPNIGPEKILEYYGPEILKWTAISTENNVFEPCTDLLVTRLGFDRDLIIKSRNWLQENPLLSRRVSDVLAHHGVMEYIVSGAVENLDAVDIIRESPRDGIVISEKRPYDYSFMSLRAKPSLQSSAGSVTTEVVNMTPGLMYDIYLDAPTGFALIYKGRPCAIVAVAPLNKQELMIYQLQGVRPLVKRKDTGGLPETEGKRSSRGLYPIDWQKAMVDCASEIANNLGMTTLAIQGAKHNKWTEPRRDNKPALLSPAKAEKAYDQVAERLGFELSVDGNWHKEISDQINATSL